MKLIRKDRELLFIWGYERQDIQQIEEATHSRNTKYNLNGKQIDRDEAIRRLVGQRREERMMVR